MNRLFSLASCRLLALLLLLLACGVPVMAQDAPPADQTPVAEPAAPAKTPPPKTARRKRAHQVGEIEPHRFIFTATFGIGARLWGGAVTGLRLTPLAELGFGVNFNKKWGVISLTRFGLNDLDHGRGNYAGWSVIGLHRHQRRQADTWGLGVAFREVPDPSRPGGYRRQYGGDALWRVDFLDKPFTYYFAADLACYPGQCALGFSGGWGFYF
jgi:hypothetical protein